MCPEASNHLSPNHTTGRLHSRSPYSNVSTQLCMKLQLQTLLLQCWQQKAAFLFPPNEQQWEYQRHPGYNLYFTMGRQMSRKTALSLQDLGSHSVMVPWPHPRPCPKQHLISSAIFGWLMIVTNRLQQATCYALHRDTGPKHTRTHAHTHNRLTAFDPGLPR